MPDYDAIAEGVKSPEVGGAPAPIIPPQHIAAAARECLPVTHEKYQNLAAEKGYDQSYARLKIMHYSHDAMIDVIIANPAIKQNELAKLFEKSVPWISRILGSDAFQAALAKRREELTDPFLIATIEERMRGLAYQSLDIISEKLEASKNVDLAVKSLEITAKSLGFGARGQGQTNNTQFVIHMPPKSANSADWAVEHGPAKLVNE